MKRRNFSTPWMLGLCEAERIYQIGGKVCIDEWYFTAEDHYAEFYPEFLQGFNAYCRHRGLI